jgi:RNA polymerase sigma-70 factor (ECF subfamily)
MNKVSVEDFNKIYLENNKKLMNYAFSMLKDFHQAQDCVQNAYKKLADQDFNKIKDHINKWLFTVCRNYSIKFLNKRNRNVQLNDNDQNEILFDELSPLENIIQNEKQIKVSALMKKHLSEREKKIIKMKFYQNLSYEQMAKKLKTSAGCIGFHLSTALKKMRKKFQESEKKELTSFSN